MRTMVVMMITLSVGCATAPAADRRPNWYRFEAPDGTFRAEFPFGRPQMRRITIGAGPRAEPVTRYTTYFDNRTFIVSVFEHERYLGKDAAALLEHYPNPEAAGIDGRVVQEEPLQMGPYVGRAVRIEGVGRGVNLRMLHADRAWVTDGRMYVITASAIDRPLSPHTTRFLESFVILK